MTRIALVRCTLAAALVLLAAAPPAARAAQPPAQVPAVPTPLPATAPAALRAAEALDIADLATPATRADLAAYRQALGEEQEVLLRLLAPVLARDGLGWAPCAPARQALSRALENVRTPTGLDFILGAGVRLDLFHCLAAEGPRDWVDEVGPAARKVALGLPRGFVRSRSLLSAGNQVAWLAGARAELAPLDVGCLAPRLAVARAAGQPRPQALDAALKACAPGGAQDR